ncbi:MAG: hypothetical protein Q7S21_04605 [archaeon]|nr:hypothetical protein [archaeon]
MPNKPISSLFERILGFFRRKKKPEIREQKKLAVESIISEEFSPKSQPMPQKSLETEVKQKAIHEFKQAVEKELKIKKRPLIKKPFKKSAKTKSRIKTKSKITLKKSKPLKKKKKLFEKAKPEILKTKQKPSQTTETEIIPAKPAKPKKLSKLKPIFEKKEKILGKKPKSEIAVEKVSKKPKQKLQKKSAPLKIVAQNIEIIQPKQKINPQIIQEPESFQQQTQAEEKFEATKDGELNIQEQIDFANEKIKHLKTQFYKRAVSEEEFRKKMFDYNEEIHLLEIEQKKGKTTINLSKLGRQSIDAAAIGSIASQMFKEKEKNSKEKIVERIIERSPRKRSSSLPEVVEKGGIITFGGKEEEEKDTETFVRQRETEAPEIITLNESGKNNSAVKRFIESKAAGKIDNDRLQHIESKIDQLMKQYNISETEIKSEVERLDAGQLVKDFDKLINLIELEHKANSLVQQPISYNPFDKTEQQLIKKQEVKSIIKEVQMHRIVTDLDRILSFVKENRTVSLKDINQKLNIDRKRITENAEILEKHGLIKIEYPPVGDMRLSDVSYTKPTMMDKKKKKQLGELIQKASK